MDFNVPNLAKGTVIPDSVKLKEVEEMKEHQLKKQQFRHDWLIAIFSSLTGLITGAVSGVLASIIYNIIVGQ